MTTIANALSELGVTEWVLRGEPTTEAEFNEMFRKVTGSDANGTAIESSNPDDWGTTWAAVSAKKTELVNAEPIRMSGLCRFSRSRQPRSAHDLLARCLPNPVRMRQRIPYLCSRYLSVKL